ncbi:hypothetical protein ACNKHQ_02905 [Shigella flexneri]
MSTSPAFAGAGLSGQTRSHHQRFIADPFAPGEHMYRTGDVARWLDCSGAVEYSRSSDEISSKFVASASSWVNGPGNAKPTGRGTGGNARLRNDGGGPPAAMRPPIGRLCGVSFPPAA